MTELSLYSNSALSAFLKMKIDPKRFEEFSFSHYSFDDEGLNRYLHDLLVNQKSRSESFFETFAMHLGHLYVVPHD